MTFDFSASGGGSDLPGSLPWRMVLLSVVFVGVVITGSGGSAPADGTVALLAQQEDKREQNYYADAHPYLEEPLEQHIKQIPELKAIQSAPDQQALPTILEKTGEQVGEFFRNVIDLIAHEEITEEKVDGRRNARRRLQVEDSYLILRRGGEIWQRAGEYRMDAKGNPIDEVGLNKGYFDTCNFALDHVYFGTTHQPESRFLYLGQEKIGSQDTYVVAFAQKPGQATITVAMEGTKGPACIIWHTCWCRELRGWIYTTFK
jgi:hypothetical protein